MKKLHFILFLLIAFSTTAQKDSLAKYTVKQLIDKSEQAFYNMDTVIKFYSEEILRRNPHDSIKAIAYWDIGDMYYGTLKNDYNQRIVYLKKSLMYAKRGNNPRYILKSLNTMAAVYVMINKNEEALACIEQIKKYTPKQPELESLIEINVYCAAYAVMGDFKKQAKIYRKNIEKIERYIASHPHEEKKVMVDLLMTKEEYSSRLITNYNYQKKLDSSAYYIQQVKLLEKKGIYDMYGIWYQETFYFILRGQYDDAIAKIEASQEKYIKGLKIDTYQSLYYLAVCYNKKGEYAKSLAYCEQALANKVIIQSFTNYELELYRLASQNAEKLGDEKKVALYSKKFIEGSQKTNYAAKADFMAKLYQIDVIDPKNEEISQKNKTANRYAILGILAGFLAVAAIIFGVIKSKRDKKKFLAVMARLDQQEATQKELPEAEEIIEEKENVAEKPIPAIKNVTSAMSDEAEKNILKRFDSFERKLKFLSPDVSISSMAIDFNTNVRYLSETIKKHKNNNFNGYINDLRIDYITSKLKNEPEYSSYKIAYLAEECGFASHAVFNRAFVQRTGIAPSKFISYLKLEFESMQAN